MVDVDLVHDVHDLVLGGVATQGTHEHTQLFGANEAIAVLKRDKKKDEKQSPNLVLGVLFLALPEVEEEEERKQGLDERGNLGTDVVSPRTWAAVSTVGFEV